MGSDGWTEITERLEAQVNAEVSFAARLKPALNLACRQLEMLSPAVMGMTDKGMVATIATTLPHGTWPIVLANRRKVLTIQMRAPPPGITRLKMLRDFVAFAREGVGNPPEASDMLHLIDQAVKRWGGQPGKRGPNVQPEVIANIVGVLFGDETTDADALIEGVEKTMGFGVCPLHVGLIGQGSRKGTICGAWPIALPFAPYIDGLGLSE